MTFLAHDCSIGKTEEYQEANKGKKSDSGIEGSITSRELEEQWDEIDGNKNRASSSGGYDENERQGSESEKLHGK